MAEQAPAAAEAPAVAAGSGGTLYEAKGCALCHGADAKSPIMTTYPKIAGFAPEYVVNQLKDIKSGARSNGQSGVMKGILAAVSEPEMQEIASWLSGQ